MSPAQPRSAPPTIPGYAYVRHLGSGGFADVFLYEQQKPRRKVAIKVLLPDVLGPEARRQFDAEADTMAQLSTHPVIVTIYEAALAPDGRPYLAMEYCPRPNYGATFRKRPLAVADALRVGVQVAGAVETAHRAGVLHRDIKPANILVTAYDNPALTDFGIAGAIDDGGVDQAAGMSIPWSPPESFEDGSPSTVGIDVWALGATVYSLLAGRSPFEVPGGPNSSADLIDRIEKVPLPPIGRAGVPEQLERVLATAMAKAPSARYPSALAFARALQQVQAAESMSVTTVDVLEDVRSGEVPEEATVNRAAIDLEPGTRIRSVRSIDPTSPGPEPGGGTTARRSAATVPDADRSFPDAVPATLRRDSTGRPAPIWATAPEPPPVDTTLHRPAAEPTPTVPDAKDAARPRRWGWVAVAVVLLAAGGVGVAALTQGDRGSAVNALTDAAVLGEPADPVALIVPTPEDLSGTVDGDAVTFSWVNPDPQDGDRYRYVVLDDLGEGGPAFTADTSVTVPADADGSTCLQVEVDRGGRLSGEPARGCAP